MRSQDEWLSPARVQKPAYSPASAEIPMSDVIVIGGGIIGLSCAWRLSQAGLAVKVFDAREVAAEASWAGAGMLAPGGEVAEDSPLTRMSLASLALYPAFVEELRSATGVAIDFQRCGAVESAFSEEEAAELERKALAQAALGIRSERVDQHGFAAARFYPDDGLVNPRDVNAALRMACADVEFHEHEPVLEIVGTGVRTMSGLYEAEWVVLAAGAWSSELCAAIPRVEPVRGHLIAYDAPGVTLNSLLRHGPTYLMQRSSGLIIAGSSTEHVGFDRRIDEAIVAQIHARACRLLPELAAFTPADRWNGFRPWIEGAMPVIGRIEGTRIWAACGHYRNGILLAPETARLISAGVRAGA
jgi:glycine oxidase